VNYRFLRRPCAGFWEAIGLRVRAVLRAFFLGGTGFRETFSRLSFGLAERFADRDLDALAFSLARLGAERFAGRATFLALLVLGVGRLGADAPGFGFTRDGLGVAGFFGLGGGAAGSSGV
jgi:hypothetical protein